jgi:hypothetical protein
MKGVHNVVYVSMLRKYFRDPEWQTTLEPVMIDQNLTFEACPVRILEEADWVMTRRTLRFVKIIWTNHRVRSNMGIGNKDAREISRAIYTR